jgi:hypothetical protein
MATVFATSAKNFGKKHAQPVFQSIYQHFGHPLGDKVAALIQAAGKNGLDHDKINSFVHSAAVPSGQSQAVKDFLTKGDYHSFAIQVQAHGSGSGFLAGAIFAVVGFIAASTLIAVKKSDLPAGEGAEPVAIH